MEDKEKYNHAMFRINWLEMEGENCKGGDMIYEDMYAHTL